MEGGAGSERSDNTGMDEATVRLRRQGRALTGMGPLGVFEDMTDGPQGKKAL